MASSDFAGKAYFNNYFILVLGIGISVILFVLSIPVFSEPRAEYATANKLGTESSIKYCEEVVSEARREKLEGRKGMIIMSLAGYAGLLEVGPIEYVNKISKNWLVFIPAIFFVLPWIPMAAGFLAFTYSLIGVWEPSFLLFLILLFSLLVTSYLLSLIVRPVLRIFTGENAHKIAIWISSIYIVGCAISSPFLLIGTSIFLLVAPSLTLILMIVSTYALIENWKKTIALVFIVYLIFTAMSAIMGMIVLWRSGFL